MTHRKKNIAVDSFLIRIALLLTFHVSAAAVSADDKDRILEESQRLVEDINVEHVVDNDWRTLPIVQQPVLRYEEPTRANSGGTVWLWGVTSRPAAILELYQPTQQSEDWVFVVNNLSGGTLRAERGGSMWWQENDSDVEMTAFPGSPTPASRPAARLVQMRLLARRFRAHEFWDQVRGRSKGVVACVDLRRALGQVVIARAWLHEDGRG